MTATLTPKKIVDKNGRRTTVYVKTPQNASSRLSKVSSPPAGKRVIKLIRDHADLQRSIVRMHGTVPFDDMRALLDKRDKMERAIKAVTNPARDDGRGIATTDLFIESPFRGAGDRVGFSNDLLKPSEPRDTLMDRSRVISDVWLDTLSSAQALALVEYTSDSKGYAVEHSEGGEFSQVWVDFEEAVAHAPVVNPFVVYTGVNEFYADSIRAQVDTGEVVLDRVFSSSLNPAQVNGFATGYSHKDGQIVKDETLALEVETFHGAFMDMVSHSVHEMEVMLPKGRYEVVGVLTDTKYLWSEEKDIGRTMNKTVQLRYLGE